MEFIKINNLLKNGFVRNLSIVFSESIVTKALSFLTILILSRSLGPEDYGKYSFIFISIAFMSAFFDFGMENTAVRFSSKEKKTNSIFGLYLIIKLLISTMVIGVLLLFGKQIFQLMDKTEINRYIPYLIFGFLGESLFLVNDTYLQAVQKFKLRAIINISRFVLLVIAVVILLLNNSLNLEQVIYLYLLPLVISFVFIHKYLEMLQSFLADKLKLSLFKEMFHYEKWMFLISVPNNTLGRIDFFLISLWVSYDQLGIYNAAFQLTAIVSFLPFAFGKVLLPKMAELSEFEIIEKTKKVMKSVLMLSVTMLFFLPFIKPVVPILFGEKYIAASAILIIMLVSSILAFVIVPIEQAFYSLGKPKFLTVGKYVQILFIVGLIFLTVPSFGVIWAAISVLIARLIYGGILLVIYNNYKKKLITSNI